jgi:hypothetical protein
MREYLFGQSPPADEPQAAAPVPPSAAPTSSPPATVPSPAVGARRAPGSAPLSPARVGRA